MKPKLWVKMGKDDNGKPFRFDFAKVRNLLITGTNEQEISCAVNTILRNLESSKETAKLKIETIDLANNDNGKSPQDYLESLAEEMDKRYILWKETGSKKELWPYVLVITGWDKIQIDEDELAGLRLFTLGGFVHIFCIIPILYKDKKSLVSR